MKRIWNAKWQEKDVLKIIKNILYNQCVQWSNGLKFNHVVNLPGTVCDDDDKFNESSTSFVQAHSIESPRTTIIHLIKNVNFRTYASQTIMVICLVCSVFEVYEFVWIKLQRQFRQDDKRKWFFLISEKRKKWTSFIVCLSTKSSFHFIIYEEFNNLWTYLQIT